MEQVWTSRYDLAGKFFFAIFLLFATKFADQATVLAYPNHQLTQQFFLHLLHLSHPNSLQFPVPLAATVNLNHEARMSRQLHWKTYRPKLGR